MSCHEQKGAGRTALTLHKGIEPSRRDHLRRAARLIDVATGAAQADFINLGGEVQHLRKPRLQPKGDLAVKDDAAAIRAARQGIERLTRAPHLFAMLFFGRRTMCNQHRVPPKGCAGEDRQQAEQIAAPAWGHRAGVANMGLGSAVIARDLPQQENRIPRHQQIG